MVKNALARIDEKGPSVAAATPSAAAAPPDHSDGSIEAMVERLAERLKKDGSDVPGWIQLVRSYRVLGRAEKANAAIADAHAALAGNPEALQRLDQGLQGLETAGAAGLRPTAGRRRRAVRSRARTPVGGARRRAPRS